MFKISNCFSNEEEYKENLDVLMYGLLRDNNIDRNKVVKVKFSDDTIIEMKNSQLLVNMILWRPFIKFNKKITKEFIFDCDKINSDTLSSYLDMIIDTFINEDNVSELNESLALIVEDLARISFYFNPVVGNTVSIYDMIKLSERNKEYDDIIHTKFDDNTTSYEIETTLKAKLAKLLDILRKENNNLKDYINAKEGINSLQLSQFAINVGNRPSLSGKTIPQPVNSNFLRGLETPSQYFIEAQSGRKAAIINNTSVKQSGYLNRKLSILSVGVNADFDTDDCGTKNTLNITIDDENILKRFDKRYYVTKNGKLKILNAKEDLNLIGKTLKFRSPVTCCSKNGICKKCYGEQLAYLNKDIHIGLLSVMELTSRLSQMLISAKHFLNTSSEKIEWPKEFSKFFIVENNTILLDISNSHNFEIKIDNKQLFESDEDIDDDTEYNHYIREFTIINKSGKTESDKKIKIKVDKDLFISPYFEDMLTKRGIKDDGFMKINTKNLNQEEPIFFVEISNEELSSHLKNVFALIESKTRLGVTDYHEMIQQFNQFLIKGKINIQSIHPEIIVYSLIRESGNLSKRPDFSIENPDYTLLRVSDAILNSGSIIERISFEKLKNQLGNPEIFSNIWKSSLFDNLFSNDVKIEDEE